MEAKTNKKCKLCRNVRAVVKFYRLRGKAPTKTFDEKIKFVYSDDCLSQMQVLALHKEFLEGKETAELHNSQLSGWPTTVSIEINVNSVKTLRILVFNFLRDVNHNGLFKIDDGKHYEETQHVPCCFNVGSTSFKETAISTMCWHDLSLMSCIVTCDVTWAYHHHPKTKQESAAWGTLWTPPQKKIHQAKICRQSDVHLFFSTNVESFIIMWSHPLVKDKNECQFRVLLWGSKNFVHTRC